MMKLEPILFIYKCGLFGWKTVVVGVGGWQWDKGLYINVVCFVKVTNFINYMMKHELTGIS